MRRDRLTRAYAQLPFCAAVVWRGGRRDVTHPKYYNIHRYYCWIKYYTTIEL